jgi:hypothetical protein
MLSWKLAAKLAFILPDDRKGRPSAVPVIRFQVETRRGFPTAAPWEWSSSKGEVRTDGNVGSAGTIRDRGMPTSPVPGVPASRGDSKGIVCPDGDE